MSNESEGQVSEETALKRQLHAACMAITNAHNEGQSLLVMVFGANDGESMTVFAIEGVDVDAVLDAAAAISWGLTGESFPVDGN